MRIVRTALAAAVTAAALTAPATAAGATTEPALDRAVGQERASVLAYWTPERVRGARPALPVLPDPTGHRPNHGGDGGGGLSVTGAPWEDADAKGMAGETTGKVLFTLKGSNYVCSGSAVTGPAGRSLVLTAGHCVHDGDGASTSWATNWMFVPAYEDGGGFTSCQDTTYGCWTASGLTTTGPWHDSGAFDDDAGFAVMAAGGKDADDALDLVTTVGAQNIAFTDPVAGSVVYAFGYPAARPYNGTDLIYCAGTAVDGVIAGTAGLGCDMTGGSSGGPWLAAFDTGSAAGTAVSVNSHKFRSIKDMMYGPVFDSHEHDAYQLAAGESASGGTGKSRP